MERVHHMLALLDQDGVALVAGEDARLRSDAADYGGADEDGFHFPGMGASGEFGLGGEACHTAVDLAAAGVALAADVHQGEALLLRMGDAGGKQDGAGAGAEDGAAASEGG